MTPLRKLRMAEKMVRCVSIARRQRAGTMAEAADRGAGWTPEDASILYRMNLADRPCWDRYSMPGNDYQTHRNYRTHLNA